MTRYQSLPSLKHHSQSAEENQTDSTVRNGAPQTSVDLAIIVNYTAADVVRSGPCQHAGGRLLGLEVLDVWLAGRVHTI